VIFFTSLDKGGIHKYIGPGTVFLTHMLFSCLVSFFCFEYFLFVNIKLFKTLLNRTLTPIYSTSLVIGYILLIGMIIYTIILRGFNINIRQRIN